MTATYHARSFLEQQIERLGVSFVTHNSDLYHAAREMQKESLVVMYAEYGIVSGVRQLVWLVRPRKEA